MSRENVETVVRCFDAWNRGDRDGWMADAHPEGELFSAMARELEGPEAVYKGHAGARQFWHDWHSVWNLEMELTETRDLGDTVVVMGRLRATGNASGAELEQTAGWVFELEDGMIRTVRGYLTPEEALKAAGLPD